MAQEKFNLKGLIIFITSLILTGCGSRDGIFYMPKRNPTPLFNKKGDIFLDGSLGIVRAEATAGYAITNSIGFYGSVAGAMNKQNDDGVILRPEVYTYYQSSSDNYNFGIGYFVNQTISSKWKFEIFGDYASGHFYNNNTVGSHSYPPVQSKDYFLNGTFKRIGFMPNFGYVNPHNLNSLVYSARFSQISFSNIEDNSSVYWEKELEQLGSKTRHNLVEHTLTWRSHEVIEGLKYHVSLGLSHYIQHQQYQQYYCSIMVGAYISTNIFR